VASAFKSPSPAHAPVRVKKHKVLEHLSIPSRIQYTYAGKIKYFETKERHLLMNPHSEFHIFAKKMGSKVFRHY